MRDALTAQAYGFPIKTSTNRGVLGVLQPLHWVPNICCSFLITLRSG